MSLPTDFGPDSGGRMKVKFDKILEKLYRNNTFREFV